MRRSRKSSSKPCRGPSAVWWIAGPSLPSTPKCFVPRRGSPPRLSADAVEHECCDQHAYARIRDADRAITRGGPGFPQGTPGPLALKGLSVQGPPRSRNAPETDGKGPTAEVCPDGTSHQTLSWFRATLRRRPEARRRRVHPEGPTARRPIDPKPGRTGATWAWS